MSPLKATALTLALATPAAAEPDVAGARLAFEPRAILDIREDLGLWLDAYTDLPRAEVPLARIELVEPASSVLYEGRMTRLDDTVRGLYDEESATIYLVRPWFGDRASDRSVLLHEMAHHRQAHQKHWYCPEAMEWGAYLVQEDYLAAHGETGNFNWGWIVLASSCAPRDHHPD